ncbi:fused MFS/spermidine synthase [Candidatus Riflebacteria bacterium]
MVFQVIWSKYFNLLFGAHIYSITAIIASFMAGLCCGSILVGQRTNKVNNCLKLYGLFEILIAIYASFFPQLLDFCDLLSGKFYAIIDIGSPVLLLFKFLFCFLILFIPTFLMGGTLPLLTHFLARFFKETSMPMAILYFTNTLGASIGCLAAGFFFIPAYGLNGTLMLTVIITATVGITACLFSATIPDAELQNLPAAPEIQSDENTALLAAKTSPTIPAFLILIICFFSGFVSMNLEIAWTRLLTLLFGSSVYSFSIILSGYLLGIASGSFIYSIFRQFYRKKNIFFQVLLFSISAFLFCWSTTLLAYSNYFIFFLKKYMKIPFEGYMVVFFLFALLTIALPMSLFGITFPMLLSFYETGTENSGRTTGIFYGTNTLGSILGTFYFTFLLLPALGLKNVILLNVFIVFSLPLSLLFYQVQTRWQEKCVISMLFLLSLPAFFIKWNPNLLQGGFFRPQIVGTNIPILRAKRRGKLLFHKEGTHAVVSIFQEKIDSKQALYLVINGKSDASAGDKGTITDTVTQTNLALIPLMAVKKQRDLKILVIGLGSGMTAGTLLHDSRVGSIEILEISPAVINACRYFTKYNNNLLDSAKVKIIVEDARNYLKFSRKKYDIIISEPSNPWISGIGNLFCLEFAQAIKEHLHEGGFGVQWFHQYEMNNDLLFSVLNTFVQEFPELQVWKNAVNRTIGDLIILLPQKSVDLKLEDIKNYFKTYGSHKILDVIGIKNPECLLYFKFITKDNLAWLLRAAPFITDDNLYLEYHAPKAFFNNENVQLNWHIIQHQLKEPLLRDIFKISRNPGVLLEIAIIKSHLTRHSSHRIFEKIYKLPGSDKKKIADLLFSYYSSTAKYEKAIHWIDEKIKHSREPLHLLIHKLLLIQKRDYHISQKGCVVFKETLQQIKNLEPENLTFPFFNGIWNVQKGEFRQAENSLLAVIKKYFAMPSEQKKKKVKHFAIEAVKLLINMNYTRKNKDKVLDLLTVAKKLNIQIPGEIFGLSEDVKVTQH